MNDKFCLFHDTLDLKENILSPLHTRLCDTSSIQAHCCQFAFELDISNVYTHTWPVFGNKMKNFGGFQMFT